MHVATMIGYMKLMVDAIPLDMFAYPISSVTEVDFVFEDDETFDMEEVDVVEESETTKKIIE